LSDSNAGAPHGAGLPPLGAHDAPAETAEEVSRRTFMANATLTIGGIVGLVLAIPIVGSLLPPANESTGSWAPLNAQELEALQKATEKPVKLTFTMRYNDGYLPEQAADLYAWGIKIDLQRFRAARPDIFGVPGPDGDLTYAPVTMGFVVFSPICPHLGCFYNWSDAQNRFMCPCHGSQYTFDGTHVAGPAPRGLDPLPLRSQNGTAEVSWIIYESNTPQRIVVSYQA
jgi:menaquinol-cytochrome c reductase iron-sulfur subunit